MDTPRPLLTQVRATHFRSLGDLTLDLGPLTVLVGPNGAGKSNVVAVLRFLRDAATRGLSYAYGQQGGSPTVPQRGHSSFKAGVTFQSARGRATFDAALKTGKGQPAVLNERLALQTRNDLRMSARIEEGELTLNSDFGHSSDGVNDLNLLEAQGIVPMQGLSVLERRDLEDAEVLTAQLPDQIRRLGVYPPPISALLRSPQREATAAPLNESGDNLAAVLAMIRDTLDGQTLDQTLERLVDDAVGYHVEHAAGFLVTFIDYAGRGDGQPTKSDLGLESDGTVRMMVLLAALYQTPPRSLLVLEEPEAGLHPGVLPVLADVIKEVAMRTQVIITTHSPDLIDCFDPDVVRIVEKVNGETVVGRVDPEQRDLIHKRLYRPSELMRTEGLVRET